MNKPLPTTEVKKFITDLASQHGVTYGKTPYDELAEVITRLPDDVAVQERRHITTGKKIPAGLVVGIEVSKGVREEEINKTKIRGNCNFRRGIT